MATQLLEREPELQILTDALSAASHGSGSVVLVSGEAGIGKTSLVRAFVAQVGARARVLTGGCDDLVTPRTLGPFRDMAHLVDGPLADALTSGAPRDELFHALYAELLRRTTVVVVEDAHWADDATLDVLRYLAWRVSDLPCLLVLTHRDDGVGPNASLRRVLGALARQDVTRLPLAGLSRDGVEVLAAGDGDPRELLQATGGNPFYLREVLASPGPRVPGTVLDAVLARLGELSPDTRQAVELLSAIPGPAERWLVEQLLDGQPATLDQAERRGVLESDVGHIRFRHEIVRRAIEQQMSATRRVACNRRILAALLPAPQVELSRLAHHAHQGGQAEQVVRYGLAAAREATATGAFREALTHYELVLSWPGRLTGSRLVNVLAERVWVLYTLSRFGAAAARAGEVVTVCEDLGDDGCTGEALTALSRMLYMINEPVASEAAIRRAIGLLEPLPAGPRLARAYSYLAAILKLTDRLPEAITRARQALELAQLCDAPDVVAHSLNYLGCALLDQGDQTGAEHLRESVQIAQQAHQYEYAQRGWTNLVEGLYRRGRFDELAEPIEAGLRYAREFGFTSHEYNLEAHRCMLLTLRGRWAQAETGLRALVAGEDRGVLATFGLVALGRLRARTADPTAGDLLEQAWQAARRTDSVQSIALAGIARVEWAWLAGRPQEAARFAEIPLVRTAGPGAELYRGELLRYLARCGVPVVGFPGCPEPYALGLAGDWRGSAAAWEAIGAPYERALELLSSGQPEPMLVALVELEKLGAVPAADLARRELRKVGVSRLPARARAGTRANPAGLTDRQGDVLALLAQHLTNAEIAARLVVSVRTVDHHVAAVLRKLGVDSRREAARRAVQLGAHR